MRIVIINFFSMKRIVLLLFLISLSLFFFVGQLFAEDIGNNIVNNIEDNIENNLEYNMENYVENNIDNNIENNLEKLSQELEVITKDTNNKNEKIKPSLKDIFGDDQTFPFVAGFGKD